MYHGMNILAIAWLLIDTQGGIVVEHGHPAARARIVSARHPRSYQVQGRETHQAVFSMIPAACSITGLIPVSIGGSGSDSSRFCCVGFESVAILHVTPYHSIEAPSLELPSAQLTSIPEGVACHRRRFFAYSRILFED
jgi:hypothetical protein